MTHHSLLNSPEALQLLERIRAVCMEFPEVAEKIDAFGHTSFRVSDKPFVMMGQKEGLPTLAIKSTPAFQDILLRQEGTNYFKTPYIGHHGWVSVQNIERIDWEETKQLIEEGFYRTAPKRLAKQLRGQ
ncbi:hypothetical protein SK3146_06121 [Paenibacillus konkukensis]|uniref:Phosphoribosylglycinamide formyltransferase n=1 Tax=Paenibacillus konkukensis TaxID=2020716 RepID=A0ABY4RXW6_9BACL|nr:MmcQ/YjbR family DNA-binding protein [Paenibacillus konkukensis]UQZ86828.1 hypothetical protein SK3146_06121 [Paenibacillus konkukensis]